MTSIDAECDSAEECDQDFSICLPRRKCVGENNCDVTEYCDEDTNFCFPRRRCKQIGDCNQHEVCKRITEEKVCMPAKRCDMNGGCKESFHDCTEGFCIPRRSLENRSIIYEIADFWSTLM